MAGDGRGNGCLAFLAVVAAGLFAILAPLSLALLNVERTLLEPNLYKDELAAQGVYERLPELVAEQLVYSGSRPSGEEEGDADSEQTLIAGAIALASPELTGCLKVELGPQAYDELGADSRPPTDTETAQVKSCLRIHGVPTGLADTHDGMPIYFWILTEEDWQAVLETLLPPEWLQTQVESVIDQVHDALKGDGSRSAVVIPMSELKARITGDAGFEAVVALIEAQAPCNEDQLAQIQALVDPSEPLKNVPICRPPDLVLMAVYPNIRATLRLLAVQVPDQVELEWGGDSGSAEDPLATPREALGVVRMVAYLSLLVPALLLGLVALLVVRSARSLLRWWGVPILAAGALAAAGALVGLASTQGTIADLVDGSKTSLTALAPGILDAEADLLNAIAQGYLRAILVQAVLVAALGAAMVAASFFVGRPAVARPQPESPLPPAA